MDINSLSKPKKIELFKSKIKESYALFNDNTDTNDKMGGPLDKK